MKNWLVGLLCAGLIIGSVFVYFTKNNKKIKYTSDTLVVYKFGGGMGTYLDTHDTIITIYTDGTYKIEIPYENGNGTYKYQDTVDEEKYKDLEKVLQENDFRTLNNKDFTKECHDCGSESLSVYFSDDEVYTSKANIFEDNRLSKEEKLYINIRNAVIKCIPKTKIDLLEKAL